MSLLLEGVLETSNDGVSKTLRNRCMCGRLRWMQAGRGLRESGASCWLLNRNSSSSSCFLRSDGLRTSRQCASWLGAECLMRRSVRVDLFLLFLLLRFHERDQSTGTLHASFAVSQNIGLQLCLGFKIEFSVRIRLIIVFHVIESRCVETVNKIRLVFKMTSETYLAPFACWPRSMDPRAAA